MIIPMTKYTFLVYHKEYPSFLDKIKELGVVHIIQSDERDTYETKQQLILIKSIEDIIKQLKKRDSETAIHVAEHIGGQEVFKRVKKFNTAIDTKSKHLKEIQKEYANVEHWGVFSVETIQKIKQNGIEISLFICPEKKFQEEWTKTYSIEEINRISGVVYFAVIHHPDLEINIEAELVQLPVRSVNEIQDEINAIRTEINDIEAQLDGYAAVYIDNLIEYKHEIEEMNDLQEVLASTLKEADEKVMLIEGWVPQVNRASLDNYLEKKHIVYVTQQPTPKDKVPILLKNNSFAKLFEPISKLFSLPSYQELDLTPFFAPFFMMFFGFCLGDAGYGIALFLGASIAKLKVKPDLKPFLTLAQFLGIGTFIFGVISGTLFGINIIDSDIAAFENIKQYMLDANQMFNLALILGIIQILFGLGVKVANQTRQFGWQYGMSSIGWIILILSLLDNFMLELTTVGMIPAYIGIAVIIYFSDPKANIFVRLGKGIWDLYGITGLFGDVLSYIRLFALGISSAILGYVINDIALQIKGIPYVGWLFFAIFLLIGHTGNLLISSLGSFVHPMRLTFVEFYKNAGFAGGGHKFKPFSKKTIKSNKGETL